MRAVERSEILDHVTYGERRERLRAEAMRAKERRRIEVGEHFVFLFENRDTVRYQVQEMMRVEKLVREADIVHELDTYNELLGGAGELGCTLLIGIDDEAERDRKLHAWLGLLEHVFLRTADGTRVGATWDPRQVGDSRLSAVQYLRFAVGASAPVAVEIAFGELRYEVQLSEDQRRALQADLDER